jgi:hypothetical protein
MKRFVFFSGGIILGLTAAFVLRSLAQQKENRSLAATYNGSVLRVSIPYEARRSGEGTLAVEVLDPEDGVVAGVDRHADIAEGAGLWRREISVPKNLPMDELVWHRLSYRFTYAGENKAAFEGVASISRILRRPSVQAFSQKSYLSGSDAAIRVIVTDPDTKTPVTSGSVRIELSSAGKPNRILYAGNLNQRGVTEAKFRFPPDLTGRHSLRYVLDTELGPVEESHEILLEEKSAVLLTTEKPIYQPGQTIHVRALALDRSSHQATAGRKLTIELEDPKGNKVFRSASQTDPYGVASAEFTLADEVNLGTWRLRALLDSGAANPTEVALEIERYVLPKFKVALELAGIENKRGYRPGDHVTGTVRANYFFGKPVDDAEISVRASGVDVARFDAGISQGRTDHSGAYRFDLWLPDYFTGHPASQGASRVVFEATVKDAAGHRESQGKPIVVSESPFLITVVPEGGTLIPGLENRAYILTSYTDGTPADTDIRVQASGIEQSVHTDRAGIAVVSLPATVVNLKVHARDRQGNSASTQVALESSTARDQILLRPEHAVYRIGEPIRLQVLATRQGGTAYVDAIKDGQTIGSYDVDLVNGRADLRLTATPEMTGTVDLNAYVFDRGAQPIGSHRLIFVQPADELKIQTELDQPVYKPGGEARIGFRVTNNKGEGVQAALGVEIIDQAVFALAEKQPGFAKVFFYLEQEAMKPRYEIHSVALPEAISSSEPSESDQRDLAAQALFSAAQVVLSNIQPQQFGPALPQNKYQPYADRYRTRLQARIEQIVKVQAQGPPRTSDICDRETLSERLRTEDLRDAWGDPLRIEPPPPGSRRFLVRSAGPDGLFYTPDDLTQFHEDRFCREPDFADIGLIGLEIERHDQRLSGTDVAGIRGIVRDPSGAVVARASITLRNLATNTLSRLTGDEAGRFTFLGLNPGDYEIRVTVPGFKISIRRFSLSKGDLATLSATLSIGSAAETVTVTAEASLLKTESGSLARVRGTSLPLMALRPFAPAKAPAPETHVRSWFPEALYVAPQIITDRQGRASITIPIADNITTWRMAMLASTKQGALGSATSSLKVFQDFFTELDLPVTLTQGDQVTLPVAVYNYSGSQGQAHLKLVEEDWFAFAGDKSEKTLTVESDKVGSSQFTIEARRIGKFKLTLKAEMDGRAKRADIVVREIEVIPNGREQNLTFNGRLEKSAEHDVVFPATAIPDAEKIFVRLYPSPMSQLVEGMDAILRMPGGCFEQTSSSTYPNVLALDYMKRTNKLTPEVHAKAESFITNGYQRLLTFEVQGGGFSWFGQAPANKILTSYGLMEFADMAKVHEVDPRLIQRTQQWLASQQQPDGSWKPDSSFINEGATNRYNSDVLRITAYIAWALETTGYQGPEVDRAYAYISRRSGTPDMYTMAVIANFAADYQKDRAFTRRVIQQLLDARLEKDDQVSWTAEETAVYGRGVSASIETTGLAVQALLKSGEGQAFTRKALNYVAARKDSSGTWGTTQATIMALRALLLSTEKGSSEARGTVKITLNGQPAEKLLLTPENNDLFHHFVLKTVDFAGSNRVSIHFEGEGSLAYQISGKYFVPWTTKPTSEPLSIDVSYDRTRLTEGDLASATVKIKNNQTRVANMIMVDLGIPPGFDLLSEDLEDYKTRTAGHKSGRLEKFSLTSTQALLYFDSIGAGDTITLHYRLRAKFPIRARTFQSRVYEYYDPEVSSQALPVALEVRKR